MIQKRNIAMYIILSIVTCGIFGIYWFICLTDDSKLAANDNESASGPVAFLLTIVTCGIYGWYWAYKLGDRVAGQTDEVTLPGILPKVKSLPCKEQYV